MNSTANLRNMPDLGNCFKTLVARTWINYNGCLIEKAGSTYIWAGKCYPTLEQAKAATHNAATALANSLNRA